MDARAGGAPASEACAVPTLDDDPDEFDKLLIPLALTGDRFVIMEAPGAGAAAAAFPAEPPAEPAAVLPRCARSLNIAPLRSGSEADESIQALLQRC